MRTLYIALLAGCIAPWPALASDIDIPNPTGCSSYTTNTAGEDAGCDAAIARETDVKAKSVMLFRRAYMEDAARDFKTYPKARADLDEAIRLWPDNALALHERGYLRNEDGLWKDAAADLDAQIRLLPSNPDGYKERALARFNLGDLKGTFEDRDTEATLQPDISVSYFSRADAAMWIGNFALAQKDIAKAVEISPQDKKKETSDFAEKRRAVLASWMHTSANGAAGCDSADKTGNYTGANLIGDCTRAFLDAPTPKAKADALTVRSIIWLVTLRDNDSAATDSIVAAAIYPDSDTLSNLGYAYVRNHHSTAAVEAFSRSIAIAPSFVNYAGRANAKLNILDYKGAFEDAKKSFDMKPNHVALTILGDVTYAQTKTYADAKTYWIAAYRLGDRDDGLMARLKEAGVPIPPPDDTAPAAPAK